jgi:hypothetical protein
MFVLGNHYTYVISVLVLGRYSNKFIPLFSLDLNLDLGYQESGW